MSWPKTLKWPNPRGSSWMEMNWHFQTVTSCLNSTSLIRFANTFAISTSPKTWGVYFATWTTQHSWRPLHTPVQAKMRSYCSIALWSNHCHAEGLPYKAMNSSPLHPACTVQDCHHRPVTFFGYKRQLCCKSALYSFRYAVSNNVIKHWIVLVQPSNVNIVFHGDNTSRPVFIQVKRLYWFCIHIHSRLKSYKK